MTGRRCRSPPAHSLLAARAGALWLILFFVVPMYFMGELALRVGLFTGVHLQLGVLELHRLALGA